MLLIELLLGHVVRLPSAVGGTALYLAFTQLELLICSSKCRTSQLRYILLAHIHIYNLLFYQLFLVEILRKLCRVSGREIHLLLFDLLRKLRRLLLLLGVEPIILGLRTRVVNRMTLSTSLILF